MEGVCDTPLHLFAQNMDITIPNVGENETSAVNMATKHSSVAPQYFVCIYLIIYCNFANMEGVCNTPLQFTAKIDWERAESAKDTFYYIKDVCQLTLVF